MNRVDPSGLISGFPGPDLNAERLIEEQIGERDVRVTWDPRVSLSLGPFNAEYSRQGPGSSVSGTLAEAGYLGLGLSFINGSAFTQAVSVGETIREGFALTPSVGVSRFGVGLSASVGSIEYTQSRTGSSWLTEMIRNRSFASNPEGAPGIFINGIGGGGSGGALSRGGVLLDRAVEFVGDLSSITGATVDPVTGQVVLVGTQGAGGAVPDLRLDDFVTAVRSVFGSAEEAGVTIDEIPGHLLDENYPALVHLFGGLDDTEMGWVVFEADRLLKIFSTGKDNVTGQPVSIPIPEYKSLLQRLVESGRTGNTHWRFWFVPTQVKLIRSADAQSFVFDRTAVQLMTEDLLVGNGAVLPEAQAMADWFNAHFSAIAAHSWPTYDYPSDLVDQNPTDPGRTDQPDPIATTEPADRQIFARLEQVAKAIAFARFLYDNRIPVDFSWIDRYTSSERNTPLETKAIRATAPDGSYFIVSGGVSLDTPNSYLADNGRALQQSENVLTGRPDELSQLWTATVDGDTRTAVPLSLGTTHVDGLDVRSDIDLSYHSPGESVFGLARFFNSSDPTQSSFGHGWRLIPYEVQFTRPEFFSSSRSPHTFLNGLREGELRITDQFTGRVLAFVSSFTTARNAQGFFGYSGVSPNGVPTFTPGGSEQPDGSTLIQDATTRHYTLTRPDGSQSVFDSKGHLLATRDNRGRAITYSYTNGRVTSISDAAGQAITLTYDGNGRVNQATGLGGEVVNYTYDPAGDLISADRVRGGQHITYSYEYDADHRLTGVTTPDRVVERTSVNDLLGRAASRGDARGNQFESDFDPASRTTVTRDVQNEATLVRRTDALGRVVSVTDQAGRVTLFTYTGTNRQPRRIDYPDPERPAVLLNYDARGNVTSIIDPVRGDTNGDGHDDHPLLFEYDANNNLLEATDARGIITAYTYNGFNQRTSMTRGVGMPQAATWTWAYDPQTGYLSSQTDAAGVTIEYDYDALGNLTRRTVAPGTAAETVTEYTYDAFSRLQTVRDGADRTVSYTYTVRDQVASVTLDGSPALAATSTHDPVSGRKLTDTDRRENTTTYTYDPATGDLLTVNESGSITRLTYDRFGNVASVSDPVGNVTAYEYDDLQRLVRTVSLGSTSRVAAAEGTSTGITVRFEDPIDSHVVDNGSDVVVRNSTGTAQPGTLNWSADERSLTWAPSAGALAQGTYSIHLRAQDGTHFVTADGELLDGEYDGRLPSGDDTPGGDFVFSWLVDDHGNDADHATALGGPGALPATLEVSGDADVFRLEAAAGTRWRFDVTPGSLVNSTLTLYGPDGRTILRQNDDVDAHVGLYGSRIEWESPQDGAYYLRVGGYVDQFFGGYELSVSLLGDDRAGNAAGAATVAIPSVTPATLELQSDTDFFAFDAQAGHRYRLATILGTLADSVLTVFGVNGTTILASSDNGGPGLASRLFWTAPADGRYYVAVFSFLGQTAGRYELTVAEDDHEDFISTATPLTPGAPQLGDIEIKRDEDLFSFTAIAGTTYRLATTLGTLADSHLALFSWNGASSTLLAQNNNYDGFASRIYWTAPANGVYYLQVSGRGGAGTYAVSATALSDDHGNDAVSATPAPLPASLAGEIEKPGDKDWFAVQLTQGARYRFEALLGTLADSAITLYGADGTTVLSTNDDFGTSLGSRIDWTATATGTYYLHVASPGNTLVGTYTFAAQQLETTPPEGTLVSPGVGAVLVTDPGHVDIAWADAGGSGLDVTTIDPTDVQIAGVAVNQVVDQGSGVWRYVYTGSLPTGTVNVTLPADHVADLAGNWNQQRVYSFVFDGQPPAANTLTPSTPTVADATAAAGPGAFTLTVVYSEAMDTSLPPLIAFPFQNPGATLAFNAGISGWSGPSTYVAAFDVADLGVALPAVDVRVTGARDVAGNLQDAADFPAAFAIDTQNPTVTAGKISVSGATGAGGTFKVGNTVTATWDNTPGGDGNADVASVAVDFAQFGGGVVTATNTAGIWSAAYVIADGTIQSAGRNVSVTVTDAAGNTTTTADDANANVDNVRPAVTVNPLSTTSGSPALSGTVDDPSAAVTVMVNGNSYPATNHGNNAWSLPAGTISPPLTAGTYDVSATAVDAAGNAGTDGGANELVIQAALFLTINNPTVSEATGPNAATATVTRNTSTAAALVVNIVNADDTELHLPPSVTIAAGQLSATFSIETVNDGDLDGDQPGLSLMVSASGFAVGAAPITITDDDTPASRTLGGHLFGTVAANTYTVLHNIIVDENRVLTIAAPSTLAFNTNRGLSVAGQLLAEAPAASQIRFTSSAATPTRGNWSGISVAAGTQPRTMLDGIVIAYAVTGLSVGVSQLTLRNSEVHDSSGDGVSVSAGSRQSLSGGQVVVTANHIHDNTGRGVSISATSGSGFTFPFANSSNSTGVIDNHIHHNGAAGIRLAASGPGGVIGTNGTASIGSVVAGNRVHHNLEGIIGTTTAGSQPGNPTSMAPSLFNNMVTDNTQDGLRFTRSGTNSSFSLTLRNNTSAGNGGAGLIHPSSSTTLAIRNNLLALNSGAGLAASTAITPPGGAVGHNLLFGNAGGNFVNYPASFGVVTSSNASGTPSDAEVNIFENPRFVGLGDYHLRYNSPAINAGNPQGAPTDDVDGETRSAVPDIGADELLDFTPPWLGPGSAATWNPGLNTLTVTGAASVIADPGGDLPFVTADGPGAELTIHPLVGTAVHLGALTMLNGALVTLAPGGNRVLVTNALAISAGAQLDLGDNDLIIDYAAGGGGGGASPLDIIEDMIAGGFNGGEWNGSGLISSAALADPNFMLGTAENALLLAPFGDGVGDDALFSGQAVDDTAVLVKFTHRVDLDLDGLITGNDAAVFNAFYSENQPTTWQFGDVDYDGIFSGNDAAIFNGFYNEALLQV